MKKEGQQQSAQGKEQEAQGQLNDLGSGISNRVAGTIGGAVAGLTGDREEQVRDLFRFRLYEMPQEDALCGNAKADLLQIRRGAQHDQGKTLQRGVESEVQKQAEAERK